MNFQPSSVNPKHSMIVIASLRSAQTYGDRSTPRTVLVVMSGIYWSQTLRWRCGRVVCSWADGCCATFVFEKRLYLKIHFRTSFSNPDNLRLHLPRLLCSNLQRTFDPSDGACCYEWYLLESDASVAVWQSYIRSVVELFSLDFLCNEKS